MADAKKNISPLTSVLIVAAVVGAGWFGIPPIRKALAIRSMPEAVERAIDPQADVAPIFEAKCARCHSGGRAKGGFSYDTREALLKGGRGGVAVIPGDSRNSPLIHQVVGVPYTAVMPQQGGRLTAEEIGILRAWIDQGAAWPAEDSD